MNMKIILVGATGVVGKEFIKLIEERNFRFESIKLLASANSVGKTIKIFDKFYSIQKLDEDSFYNYDLAFFFVSSEISANYIPIAVKSGCKVIDNSSEFRLSKPLIIPEINIKNISIKDSIIANPNCSTILLCMVLFPLNKISSIKHLVISTYQALSGVGKKGIDELHSQINSFNHGYIVKQKHFKSQCLNNVFSHDSPIDYNTGDNQEETKIINETRKILNKPELIIDVTCIRVPVERAHCESVYIEFEDEVNINDINESLLNSNGVILYDDRINETFPEPIITSNKNDIFVGRIRQNPNNKKSINLFLSGDQLRKGAALNAMQIAENF